MYLEWILLGLLLGLIVGTTILPSNWYFPLPNLGLTILLILIFWGLGLSLPFNKSSWFKALYTLIELIVILLILITGGLRGLVLPFLVLVIRSCLLFNRIGQVWVMLGSLSTCTVAWIFIYRHVETLPPESLEPALRSFGILFQLMFGLSVIFLFVMINVLRQERESRQQLAIAHQQLKDYSSIVEVQATLQERQRIAREVHDSLGHSLVALNLQLEAAIKLWESRPQQASNCVGQAKKIGDTSLTELRELVNVFALEDLEGALRRLLMPQKWDGVRINIDLQIQQVISPRVQGQLYRICQEVLNNIRKHAQATQIDVSVYTDPCLSITIKDNGCGFNDLSSCLGNGLKNIRTRSLDLGGTCQIVSSEGAGTIIEVKIPNNSATL